MQVTRLQSVLNHRGLLLAASLLIPCLGASAVNFTAGDIVDGKIVYAYNAMGDVSYINGVSTGLSFTDSVTRVSGGEVVNNNWGNVSFVRSAAPNSRSGDTNIFAWTFAAPENYQITGITIESRLTALADNVAGNTASLSYAFNGSAISTVFQTLTTTGAISDTGKRSYTISENEILDVTAVTIAGSFIFEATEPSAAFLQMFRSENAGSERATFIITLDLVQIPESSSTTLILGAVTLLGLCGWRYRSKLRR